MSINGERLWSHLHELAEIGADEQGGVTRFSFTELDNLAKQQVKHYMLDAGLDVREDEIGNLIGRLQGSDSAAPLVITGSHIDTVKHGGKFDGALGVISAIEALHTMKEQGFIPKHSIEVIAFSDEEGSRFGFGMIGSRALAGTLKQPDLAHKDEQGISIADALKQAGYEPLAIQQAARKPENIKGYIELHIEQGRVLEQYQAPVGIVTGIAGPLWQQFTLTGQAGHAGATPMTMRRDPLQVASLIFQFIYNEAKSYSSAVATIGKLRLLPGGVNIIPSEVQFSLDLRDIDEAQRNKLEDSIQNFAKKVCEEHGIELQIDLLQRVKPVPSSPEIMLQIQKAAEALGNTSIPSLVSGAGHDGMQFHSLCPIGMIFVRSKDGISHDPAEWSSRDDCEAGANLLYETLIRMSTAKREL